MDNKQDNTIEPLINVNDGAKLLCLHPQTIRQFVREGRLKAYRIGGNIKFKKSDLMAYIEKSQIKPDMNYENLKEVLNQ